LLLLEVLKDPAAAPTLDTAQWSALIGAARHARLLPRLALLLEDGPLAGSLPEPVRDQLAGARPLAGQHERIVRWETGRIREALRATPTRVVLLKGAAYIAAGLPASRGRVVTDVDILVPASDLRQVEGALLAAGWEPVKLDRYDQRYYRDWMHELPPLQHRRRTSVVDVHHNILPLSGRLHPNAAALLERAVPCGPKGFFVLGPEDMVLHGAAHLFQDGELAGAVRDLVDADALLRDFGARFPGFWDRLVPRARQLELERPLFYALRYAERLLATPIPAPVTDAAAEAAPSLPVLKLMDALVQRALLPAGAGRATTGEERARMLLYARSHWLRMPHGRLAAHLGHKALRRLGLRSAELT
jgi:Uncharacterised nucleotidyltransferase